MLISSFYQISENDENKESDGFQIFEIDTLQERNPESMSSSSSFTLKDDDQFVCIASFICNFN